MMMGLWSWFLVLEGCAEVVGREGLRQVCHRLTFMGSMMGVSKASRVGQVV